jgi:hypothetical protein
VCPLLSVEFCVLCLFECGVLFCVLCLIVVPLPPGKNPFAVKINNNSKWSVNQDTNQTRSLVTASRDIMYSESTDKILMCVCEEQYTKFQRGCMIDYLWMLLVRHGLRCLTPRIVWQVALQRNTGVNNTKYYLSSDETSRWILSERYTTKEEQIWLLHYIGAYVMQVSIQTPSYKIETRQAP